MKILAINCNNIDLSYFTKRGLTFDIDYATIDRKFAMKPIYTTRDANGTEFTIATPDIHKYLSDTYMTYKYVFIIYAWNPADYPENGTGGYSYPNPIPCGTYWCTVRNNENVNSYILHELHHLLCDLLIFTMGKIATVKDQMDMTLVNGQMMPYYKNGTPDAPDSNFARTWNTIKPFIKNLQDIKYDVDKSTVTITRNSDNGFQSLGTLKCGSFTCKTLERPWKENKKNISCIPKGTYNVKWTLSPRLMKYTYEIQNIPGRSGIRIHPGNYFFDVDGCILLGDSYKDLNKDKQVDILNSRATLGKFETLLAKRDFTLIIK